MRNLETAYRNGADGTPVLTIYLNGELYALSAFVPFDLWARKFRMAEIEENVHRYEGESIRYYTCAACGSGPGGWQLPGTVPYHEAYSLFCTHAKKRHLDHPHNDGAKLVVVDKSPKFTPQQVASRNIRIRKRRAAQRMF